MPIASPSRLYSRFSTASAIRALDRNAAISFALPSGSSPPEKPPGSASILHVESDLTIAFTLSSTSCGVRFLTTNTTGSAPASSNRLAVSVSQLVPGNTGMKTLTFFGFFAPLGLVRGAPSPS